jgi:hypothetical protein
VGVVRPKGYLPHAAQGACDVRGADLSHPNEGGTNTMPRDPIYVLLYVILFIVLIVVLFRVLGIAL